MRAAWYERMGPAADVLVVGDMPTPEPGPHEVRIRMEVSGINPGDLKKRQGWQGGQMPYPRVVPHSDGAGVIDAVGEGVPETRLSEPVWCYGAQSYRPFGTAAEFTVVPSELAVGRPGTLDATQGACLGIPGITAHRAVFADGSVEGKVVLVAGGAGAVGRAAIALARRGGATVMTTVTHSEQVDAAAEAGAHTVVDLSAGDLVRQVRDLNGERGVDRVIEVAFAANVAADTEILTQGGIIAAYSTGSPEPAIPFWPLAFKNVTIRLLGSDDFPADARRKAASDLTVAAAAGDLRYRIAARFPLTEIAAAHEAAARPGGGGRVVMDVAATKNS
jgi:NADPH2:quinone reductase